MSSLAAARADGFYYPPEFYEEDAMKKHGGSLNKFNGQHPLRERAKKMDQGILVIRFEVPFHIYCGKCNEMIAKGERFNAEKKAIGNYLSTKIWQFSMRHHCGGNIVIQTDPKNAEYLVVEGARKKVETYSSKDIGVIELDDPQDKAKREADPFFKLEFGEKAKAKAKEGVLSLVQLQDYNEVKHYDDYELNKSLRAQLRKVKKDDADLDARRQELNLPSEVRLLPEDAADANQAALAFFADERSGRRSKRAAEDVRRKILSESIFGGRGDSSWHGVRDAHMGMDSSSGGLQAGEAQHVRRMTGEGTAMPKPSPASTSAPQLPRVRISVLPRDGCAASLSGCDGGGAPGHHSHTGLHKHGRIQACASTSKPSSGIDTSKHASSAHERMESPVGTGRDVTSAAAVAPQPESCSGRQGEASIPPGATGQAKMRVSRLADLGSGTEGKMGSSSGVGKLLPDRLPGRKLPAGSNSSTQAGSRQVGLQATRALAHSAGRPAASATATRPLPKGLIGGKRKSSAQTSDPLLDRAQALAQRQLMGGIKMQLPKQ